MAASSDLRSPVRGRLLVAERFTAPDAELAEVLIPLDVICRQSANRLRLVVLSESRGSTDHRVVTLTGHRLSKNDSLRLAFAPFEMSAGTTFVLGALDVSDANGDTDVAELRAILDAAAGRAPITLECLPRSSACENAGLLADESGIAAFVVRQNGSSQIRTAHALDAFWCDAHGVYLRGWIHAYEHRVRSLRVESAGRSAQVAEWTDRPDLLTHYPQHDHVRYGGFAVYLECPPGNPVTLTLGTEGGDAVFALPLPAGSIPAWPEEESPHAEISPVLRRFAELANARGGRALHVGVRTGPGLAPTPPHPLLRGRVIGLDIHPGLNVDLVGDAHSLSRFLRERSFGAVFSASVLEHLEAPWLLAMEINRILEPGGLVYHQVPGAWPAHAQPNDFWRFSAEGLRVLFGPATGFEVLEATDSGAAAIIPSPSWRRNFLDMPTVPAFTSAEILARKVGEIEPGAVSWPLGSGASEARSRRYPPEALRPIPPGGNS